MTYLFLLFLITQTVNGKITITVLDDQDNPQASDRIELMSEQGQVVGGCTTSSNGSCTIFVEEITTDASGLIRGGLTIASRGKRSVIWPGGPLEITIRLDENGQVFVPSDHYITPTPDSTATTTPESTATTTPESTATTTPESTAITAAQSTTTTTPEITPPEIVSPTITPDQNLFYRGLFIYCFVYFNFIKFYGFYIYKK